MRLRKARERRAGGSSSPRAARGRARSRGRAHDPRDLLRARAARLGRRRGGERARARARWATATSPRACSPWSRSPQRELPARRTLLLVAVGIEKPGNLGAMARTADAAGADALLVGDGECDPWNPNAIRASTGAVFTLPIVEATADDVARAAAPRRSPRSSARRSDTPTPTHRPDRVPDRRRRRRPRRGLA